MVSASDSGTEEAVALLGEPIEAVPLRHWGRWVGAAAASAFVLLLARAVAINDNIDWNAVAHYLTAGEILSGVVVTLELTILAMVIGIALGIGLAVMRQSHNPVLRAISGAYIFVFRGTPLLVQIILWFNAALLFPRIGVGDFAVETNTIVTAFVAAVLALGLNEGAYMAEIVRGGINAVDGGQLEAANALGMTRGQAFRRVVLPQAMRVIIPPTGNEVINMLKTTALVSVVSAHDLLTNAQAIYSQTYEVVDLLIVASLWYLAMTTVATTAQRMLEKRYSRGVAARPRRRVLRARAAA